MELAPIPDGHHLLVFMAAAVPLIVIPGPAVFYVVARSVSQGRTAGLVSALGVGLGGLAHVAAAALGVSALVLASATAFTALKLVGAAYLVYLGIRAFTDRDGGVATPLPKVRPMTRVFADGALVNLFNPKTALFFLAFIPQFVDIPAGAVPGQIALLGILFVLIALVSDATYALLAGRVASRVEVSAGARRARRWLSGGIYLGLGVATALTSTGEGYEPS